LLEGVSGYAVDMQKVIILPKLATKEIFFVRRLVGFNETFASLSESQIMLSFGMREYQGD
jgi:hypothetical protein